MATTDCRLVVVQTVSEDRRPLFATLCINPDLQGHEIVRRQVHWWGLRGIVTHAVTLGERQGGACGYKICSRARLRACLAKVTAAEQR